MAYQLGRRTTKDEAVQFRVYYDDAQKVVESGDREQFEGGELEEPLGENGVPLDFMTFFLSQLNGQVQRKIADSASQIDHRTGKGKLLTGTIIMQKCIASVVAVEGLELDGSGRDVTHMDAKVYDKLGSDVCNVLAKRVNQLLGDDMDDEEVDAYFEG